MRQIAALANEINGFPRHLSQHVGGFVITRSRLDEVMPIGNGAMPDRTFVEWDKDDLDALGILKIDVLGLGMLSCIREGVRFWWRSTYAAIAALRRSPPSPPKKPAVYDMLGRADSLGVFQVESRAQMTMLPRLKPKNFYDLVIEVAIVRPGPIQGDMVHPYLRRRSGQETVTYPSKELEAVLSKTLGVPLFQEQAMKIAIVAAGFTPSEADRLRRAMATFKRVGTIGTFQRKMIDGMLANGYERSFAERCFQQIEGFGEYGFPESHAASFALLVYASAWLKCRYPDAFAAALLERAADGLLRAGADRARRARARRRGARAGRQSFAVGFDARSPGPRAAERLHELHREMRDDIRATHAIRLGLREIKGLKRGGCAESASCEQDAAPATTPCAMSGCARGSRRACWSGWPMPTPSPRSASPAAKRCGRRRRSAASATATTICRLFASSPPPEGEVDARSRREGVSRDNRMTPSPNPPPSGGGSTLCTWRREAEVHLPPMPLGEEVVNDYRFLRLSLRAHPAQFLRADLAARGTSCATRRCARLPPASACASPGWSPAGSGRARPRAWCS